MLRCVLRRVSARRRRTSRDERGAAAIEFALVMPLLLLLVFGIIQYGWHFYAMQAGTSAASDLARRLSVGDCVGGGATLVENRLGPAAPGTPDVTAPGALNPDDIGDTITVTVTFDTIDFNFPLIPYDPTVSRTASARLEDTTSSGSCS